MRQRRFFLLSVCHLLACIAMNAQIARDAGKLFQDYCAGCHGHDMRGSKAGSLLDDVWRNGGDDESIERSIRQGMPRSGMPAFAALLSEAESRAMVVLIREAARRTVSPELKGAYPLPEGVQENGGQRYRVELVAEGFDVPWAMAFLGPNRLLVTERPGRLRLIENGALQERPLDGVPKVWARDEGGLLGVAVHPQFNANGFIYLSYSDPADENHAMTKVIRARLSGHGLTDLHTIFSVPKDEYQDSGMNFGSRLLIHGEHLFFTIGERGQLGQAQDLTKPTGKIHRVLLDGAIPPDNPFVNTPAAIGSIWSIGNRNAQGLAVNPANGDLWETEHGPRGGDELNRIEKGKNYGWPVVTFGMNYDGTPVSPITHKDGMEPPIMQWTPSIATCPIMFYSGDRFPAWKNHLFVGSLAQQEFLRFEVNGDKVQNESRVFKNLGRVRDIQTSPDGLIYVALEVPGRPGRIIRLVPAE
jgi:aldose sugar dehydrogenase